MKQNKKGKWVDEGGYLPKPRRGYPWKCDCVAGNPEPDRIIVDTRLHDMGCPVRARINDPSYVKKFDIFGRDLSSSILG